jgi:hypothetical protein
MFVSLIKSRFYYRCTTVGPLKFVKKSFGPEIGALMNSTWERAISAETFLFSRPVRKTRATGIEDELR